MLSLDRIRELHDAPDMSDEEAEEIRRVCHELAVLALWAWELERKRRMRYTDTSDDEAPDPES